MPFIPFRNAACCALLALSLGAAAQEVKIESQGEAFVASQARALSDGALARNALGAPPEGRAQVVFFRPGSYAASAPALDLYDNTVDVGDLRNGTYVVATVDPGMHAFGFAPDTANPLRVNVKAGKTVFVRSATGRTTGRPTLSASNASAFLAAAKADR